jgi:hypothetical protein
MAMKNTGMFIVPSKVKNLGKHVAPELPYVANYSFGDLVLANVGRAASGSRHG